MYGVGPTGTGANALQIHNTGAGNPLLSEQRVNPAVDVGNLGSDFPMGQLLRAHGILMLIAWPLLAVSGIFFAAWMRPALPNGEWFQVCRQKINGKMHINKDFQCILFALVSDPPSFSSFFSLCWSYWFYVGLHCSRSKSNTWTYKL